MIKWDWANWLIRWRSLFECDFQWEVLLVEGVLSAVLGADVVGFLFFASQVSGVEKEPIVILFIQRQRELVFEPYTEEVEVGSMQGADSNILDFLTRFILNNKPVLSFIWVHRMRGKDLMLED